VDSNRLTLPGFVTAHSHAFQRALRGRGAGGDFWAWREAMLAEAALQTPETVLAGYTRTYEEMLAAGYTAVGEFHYLGLDEAVAAAEAARAAEIEIVLLLAAYERGGLERFRQGSVAEYLDQVDRLASGGVRVGLAPHSVRACSDGWLAEIGAFAERAGLVLHVHACEQPREIEECLSEHGVRPVELLARCGCLGPRTTIVHATHASPGELDLIADAGATVCICPTTEANLGDGFPPLVGLLQRGIRLAIGSDSNVRLDPLEELRELEGTARRQTGRREIIAVDELLTIGSTTGAQALGLETWPDVECDLAHPALQSVDRADARAALIFSCSANGLFAK
jgi:formimidoylglutamate deiminase